MNLYIRYFDDEVVVKNVNEALDFIAGIEDFNITPQFEADFRQYVEGSMPYPKRYKVRTRVYFIVIKTTAETLEEFKANGKTQQSETEVMGEMEEGNVAENPRPFMRPKDQALMRLNDEAPGWYEGVVNFKRVVRNAHTGKFDYVDTTFAARVKAWSGIDCYNRIIDHLRTRGDIDPRSQFPSAKGKNFHFTYLGLKPYEEVAV